MAQPPHFEIDGGIYFITTRIKHDDRALTEHEAEIVANTILESSTKKEITLYAYVIMPNHMHILIKPVANGISKTMQLLKGRSSRRLNIYREVKASPTPCSKELANLGRGDFSRPSNFWQKGFFDFGILTEEKFREKFNYIHSNPVKWGLVKEAEDYKYSSASMYKAEYSEVFYNIKGG
jgi:REP element-mobilizing transposase RayT